MGLTTGRREEKIYKSTSVIVVWENAQNSVGNNTGDSRKVRKM
jgi:hypothetical protein